jgi:hypothetical protein
MSKITGGVVSIEDGIKKSEEFAPARKARVELHFEVAEDADGKALLDHVTAIAEAKLNEILKRPASAKDALAAAAGVDQAAVDAATKPTRQAGPRKPAEPKPEPKVEPKPAVDPAAIVDEPETATEDLNFVPPAEPAKAIPDADLHSAMTRTQEKIKNAVAIRQLVKSFDPNTDPKAPYQAAQIAQERRQEFLDGLSKLKVVS